MSELEKFKLHYEALPTDDLLKKLQKRSQSAKLKAIKGGWVAQIKIRLDKNNREEISKIANSPQEALVELDKELEMRGLYDRHAKRM